MPRALLLFSFTAFMIAVDMLLVAPILPMLMAELSIPRVLSGAISASYAAAYAVTSLLMAPLNDRLRRRTLLVTGTVVFAAGNFACGVAGSAEALVAFRVATGIGAAMITPSMWAATGALVPPERLARAMGMIWGAMSLATIVGVPLGAQVSAVAGWRVMFQVLGALSALAAIAYARLPAGASAPPAREPYLRQFAAVLTHPGAARALAATFLWNVSLFGLFAFIGALYHDAFGSATGTVGLYVLTGGVGNLAGSIIGGRAGDRHGKVRVVRTAAGCAAAGVLATSLTVSLPVTVGAHVMWSFAVGLGMASLSALVVSQLPQRRGTVMSLNAFSMNVAVVVGAGLGGAMLAGGQAYWPLGVACAVAGALVAAVVPDMPATASAAPQPATAAAPPPGHLRPVAE